MLAVFLAAVLNATLEGLPLESLLGEASLVVVGEAVEIHELDGTSVEEVRILRTIKGAAPADRLYYAQPCGCGGVPRLAEKGERLLLFLQSGEREVQTRAFWKALDDLTTSDAFLALSGYQMGRFLAGADGLVELSPADGDEPPSTTPLSELVDQVEIVQKRRTGKLK